MFAELLQRAGSIKLVLDWQQRPDTLPPSAGLLQRVRRSESEAGVERIS